MTKAEIIEALDKLQEAHEMFLETWHKVVDFFGATSDSPLFMAWSQSFDLSIEFLAKASGIHSAAISWHVYYNKWGAEMARCSKEWDTKGFNITSNADFVEFELGGEKE